LSIPKRKPPTRKSPSQERSRATVDAILDATELLAAEMGIEQVKMAAVARRAGVSQGTLYGYFADITALADAWAARVFDRAAADAGMLLARLLETHPPLEEGVRQLVELCVDRIDTHFRCFRDRSRTDFLSHLVDRAERIEQIISTVASALSMARDQHRLRTTDHRTAARVVVKIVIFLVYDRVSSDFHDDEASRAYRAGIVDAVIHCLVRDPEAVERAT
jgi:AcrR family transcriptional regulator